MKIAIACHPTYGGSGVVASELGMALAQRGHEVHFVSYQVPFRVDRLLDGVHVHEVDVPSYPLFKYPSYALALASKLVEVVRASGVRLLHMHYAIPHAISGILARQMCSDCGVRVLTTLHGTDITLVGSDHSYFEITRWGIEQSDLVTAVSRDLARETRRQFKTTRSIEVVPNFVDTEHYTPALRRPALRARFAAESEALLVHISNFRPVKRVLDVIEVFHRVRERLPARLLMIGTGPDVGIAEERVATLGLSNHVTFAGGMTGVGELLAVTDLFLLPSESESFGLAALEAMASGVPVVGTRAGGLPEVVEHGRSGALHAVGDVEGMAHSAVDILADPARLAGMRRAARERAVGEFPLERVIVEYEQLYERLIASAEADCRDRSG
ncbi:MAG: N-acetyl-alpha-D-glucosaminyl L-malate synthase BshA [Planctomycetota bacterium]